MPTYNIRDLAYTGKGSIEFPIAGLERWNDPLTLELRVTRKRRESYQPLTEPDHHWKFEIDTPGYSHILKDGYTYEQAYANLADAYRLASQEMAHLITRSAEMELIFQEGEAHRRAEQERQMAEAEAARAQDTAVGKRLAKKIIEHMKVKGRELATWSSTDIRAYDRGTRRERIIKVERSRAGLLLFSENYNRISKDSAIRIVADSHLDSLEVTNIDFGDPALMKFLMRV